MKTLFEYNWEVRDEWLEWCRKLPEAELEKERTGGIGSILKTLFHMIDVEISWIYAIIGKEEFQPEPNDYQNLEKICHLSQQYREEMRMMIDQILLDANSRVYINWWKQTFSKGDILRHLIAHEIHHAGQLSVWSRQIAIAPVSATLLDRECINH